MSYKINTVKHLCITSSASARLMTWLHVKENYSEKNSKLLQCFISHSGYMRNKTPKWFQNHSRVLFKT